MDVVRRTVSIPSGDRTRFKAHLCPRGRDTLKLVDLYSQNGCLRALLAFMCGQSETACCALSFACTRQRPAVALPPDLEASLTLRDAP